MLLPAGEIHAEVKRGNRVERVGWDNASEGDAGITMEYDFDPARAERLGETILDCAGRSVLLVSELGRAVVGEVLTLLSIGQDQAETVAVANRTFGGTIKAAGLLTVDDYLEAYRAWARSGRNVTSGAAQIIIPLESFDTRGLDLKRRHFSELQEHSGLPVLLR